MADRGGMVERTPLRMSTERTPLNMDAPLGPSYVFPGVIRRARRRQVRQFQCCICSIFMSAVALALVISISYSLTDNVTKDITDSSLNDTTLDTPEIFDNTTDILAILILLDQPISDEVADGWALPEPTQADIVEAQNSGLKALGDKEILEENISSPAKNTPSFRHQRAISTTAEARRLSKRGYVENFATQHVAQKFNYKKKLGRSNIGKGPQLHLSNVNKTQTCAFHSEYRPFNGTCNNRNHPTNYGVAMTPFRRALSPDYGDGISTPRQSHSNAVLPSARKVSMTVHRPSYSSDPHFTVMLAVWGQFLDHDITATALSQGQDGEPIDCCAPSTQAHPECFPVPLEPGDPYFDDYNVTCMNFIRSAPAPTGFFGPRQQLNQATAFIDGSVVYGNTEEKQRNLRTGRNGTLRMFNTPDNRTLLPISTDPNDGCNEVAMNTKGRYCFESGDTRANENLHLTSLHLLFARHHNSLAEGLQMVNQHWDDETVFQETRKILGAQMQHITYNEFLPTLFSMEFLQKKLLLPMIFNETTTFHQDTYNGSVDPSIANHFAGSAFRFAHTLIPGLMKMTKANNDSPDSIQLHKMLFNPYSLWSEGGVDEAVGSAVNTLLAKSDQFFTTELTQKLFEGSPSSSVNEDIKSCGLDLVSLNIQRGRDHGLPAYHEWRRHCQLPPVNTWERMSYAVDPGSLENMKAIYNDAKDVDLYTGALSEPPMEGAILGPLLGCLISDQFIRLKAGDSYWYERTTGPQKFSTDQLQEIYKTTLAGIICQNSDGINKSQKYLMRKVDNSTNPITDCDELTDFDFTKWKTKTHRNEMVSIHTSASESLIVAITNKDHNRNVTNPL